MKKKYISFIIVIMMILIVFNSCSGANIVTETTIITTQTTEVTTNPIETTIEPEIETPLIFILDEEGWKEYGIPSSFDLRSVDTDGDGIGDRCFVTKVKLQNPYGTCWGFASLSASEVTLLGSLYLNDPDAYKKVDLSEKQFTYFLNTPLDDNNNPQNGEGYYSKDNTNDSKYNTGGLSYFALSLFAQGIGLSEEFKEGNEIFIYRGANGYTEQRYINGEFRNFCYSDEDDWSIPEEYRFKFDYLLKTAFLLESPAKYVDGEYVYNPEATEAMKLQLLQRRGIDLSFYADTASPDDDDDEPGIYINPFTWSHYTWENKYANHSVTVVGWDDNYPKENFLSEHQPPENGAWLIKNSWGSGEEDFPNYGDGDWGVKVPLKDENGNIVKDEQGEPIMVGSGYFWISYYDMSLADPTVYIFEEKTEENDYIINQHNYLPLSELDYIKSEDETKIANVFKANNAQILDAISIVVPNNNLKVNYKVYLLSNKFNDPEDGLLVCEGNDSFSQMGLYRIKLGNQTLVQQNQYYSIVVTMTDEDGSYYRNRSEELQYVNEKNVDTVINKNESFYYNDGTWTDLKEYSDNLKANSDSLSSITIVDNYPIKSFSYNVDGKMNIRLSDMGDEAWKIYLEEDKNTTIVKVRFEGEANREMGTQQITWGVAEENQDIIAIEELKNGSQVRITALKPGTVHLTASVDGVGTTVARLVIHDYLIRFIYVDDVVCNGEEQTPSVYISTNNGKVLKEGEDYTLVYSNNVNCGVGKVEIIPKEAKFADNISNVKYFAILPPVPEIVSVSLSDGKLKGSFVDLFESGIEWYGICYRKVGTYEWDYDYFYSVDFEIDVEKDCDYEFGCYSACLVDGMEMDEDMAMELYDEAEGHYYVYSDWSDDIVVVHQ